MRAAENAYAPYSEYRVGAIVVAEDGSRFAGANVENAAFPSTLCAEAVAIGTAAAAGVRSIDTVAVGCLDDDACMPCGNCRQMMVEFGVKRVIVGAGPGAVRSIPFEEVLPDSFGPDSL
ncbi:MAG: cytidine deaminase [Acidimicrobiia bacterium]|nr:cytidine deaminase [Acidimicrobiia bacterium]NNC76287.1 cytidine deaminase [Acidimicrobiia bacterium]